MLKVGVFGVGHLGKFHLNNWKLIPEVELVGFFDPNNDHAKEVEATYGLKRYMDEDALIAACDIIDVVTPTIYISLFVKLPLKWASMFLLKSQWRIPLKRARLL